MAKTPISAIRLQGWKDGVNLEADDTTISQTELSNALNVSIGLNGEISKRKGYAAYSTSNHANMAGGRALFFWNQLGSSSDYLIYVDADGDVFASATADFSSAAVHDFTADTGDADYPIGFAIYANVVYMTSKRAANAVKFDGTTWTALTDYTMDGSGSEFPRASFLVNKHERMFAANINNNGTQERSRIRWSNLGDPTTWNSIDWIDVDPDDGSEITGMVAFADGIVIFKEKSMFFLSGVDANSFTLFPIDSTVGTKSPGTIAVTENAIFFFDNNKGIYQFDGAEAKRVSDKINTDILTTASNSNQKYNKGFFYRDKLYICLHDGTALNYTWVYDTRTKAWVRFNNGFHAATTKDGAMYVAGAIDSGDAEDIGIYTWLSGETDAGTSYTATFRTGWIAPEDSKFSGRRFRMRYVDVVAEEGSGTLEVDLYEDFKTSTKVDGTASLDNNNYDHVHRRVSFAPALQSGRTTFQLELQMTSSTDTFKVSGIDVLISPRMRERGANI